LIRNLWKRSAVATLVLAGTVVVASSAWAASDPWAKGAQWMSLRAGYARASGEQMGNGLGGYGMGYTRMLNKRWSLGVSASHEVLSRAAGAHVIEAPFTLELARHYRWTTPVRPFLGVGGGMFLYGPRRTGADYIDARPGGLLMLGANTPVAERQLLGFDVRMLLVAGDEDLVNPVFGAEEGTLLQWTAKVNWSFAY
jgi:hypothetical protein